MRRALSNRSASGVLLVLLSMLFISGCAQDASSNQASSQRDSAVSDSQSAAAPEAVEITLEVATKQEFDELLKQHRGKVILIDFWATWCAPCEEQFAHTVQLHRKYGDRGLAVISLSLDDDVNREKALDFLQSQGATFDNLMSPYSMGDISFDIFEIDNGSVPHYQVYDREGNLARKFATGDPMAEPFTPDDVERAVVALLDSSADGD